MTTESAPAQVLDAALESNAAWHESLAVEWLRELIAERSTFGHETGAVAAAARIAGGIGLRVEHALFPMELSQDEFYTAHGAGTEVWAEKYNVVVTPAAARRGEGKSLILNAHLDVVDAPPEFADAFVAKRSGSRLVGRGAADDKGSAVSMLLALKMLSDARIELAAPLELHLVIEEEAGGNGSLALIRSRPRADGVIVGEPTSLNVHPANRGALWFKLTTTGVSTHMGRAHEGVNAIEKAMEAIKRLRALEEELLKESRGYRQFERYDRPIQLNIGTISGGAHPSMVPEKAVVEGGMGFLPNKSLADIERAIRDCVRSTGDAWLRDHHELTFNKVRNDAYEIPGDHPLPQALAQSCRDCGERGEVFGWNVSCDARLYAKVGGMPAVVFGPGDIKQAHATGESVEIPEVVKAARILAKFILAWCGGRTV